MYIYERRKKKVGKSWEFNFLYSNLLEFPNGKFRRDRHRADKTHYRQTFPPPDHDARGKNLSFKVSQCRTRSPRFRRSLIFRKCSNRERERECRESGVVTSTSFAKTSRDLARPRITKPWSGSQQQHLRVISNFGKRKKFVPRWILESLWLPLFPSRKRFSPTFNPEKFREIQANVRLHGNRMRVLLIEEDQGDFFTIFKSMQFLSGAVQY